MEHIKAERDGLDILDDIPLFERVGWEAVSEADRERLKWAGVFFRKQTPGNFMMRVRTTNGFSNSDQFRVLAEISDTFGKGFADITTRQQFQLRWFDIRNVSTIHRMLADVGLSTLQTGNDNVRGVVGCPVSGLTSSELFDASPIAMSFTQRFLKNREYTNLPRKLNVTITGCTENCAHVESQDIGLYPATFEADAETRVGFNVVAGGKMGSGGFRVATPLDVFVEPDEAVDVVEAITMLFRDHGSRERRTRARLAFLIEEWGADRMRYEVEERLGRSLRRAGKDARAKKRNNHVGIFRQKEDALNYVGLLVPVGRITTGEMREIARIADEYGTGELRLTIEQNVIIAGVPDGKIGDLTTEPLLQRFRYDPPGVTQGLLSCTGIDYCHFALVETKELAIETANYLEAKLDGTKPLSMHWSGCPNGCGNHEAADIGLLGKRTKIDGKVVDAVDIYLGGRTGANPKPGTKLMENVPCSRLPMVLEQIAPYYTNKS